MYYNSWYRSRKKAKKNKPASGQRIKYGQTWWGEQWLNALTNIDFDNRLPRGRAYAGNGSVLETNINVNTIKAKVEGSMPRPYNISITIPLFTGIQRNKLLEEVKKDHFILSKLLNRELPQELHRVALDHGIKLFPSTWKDFSMNCSCPDWAVPCKHLAAVIYVISNEIDANPFLVLKLHGLDLLDELKGTEAVVAGHAEELISAIEDLLVKDVPEPEASPDFNSEALPDFSTIPANGSALLSLLPPKPLFYHKNFSEILQSGYRNLAKGMRKRSPGLIIPRLAKLAERISSFDDAMILMNPDLSVNDVALVMEGDATLESRLPFSDFIALIEGLEPSLLANCNDALRGIEVHRLFAAALALNGAVIPQMLTNGKSEMMIRWIPAVNDPALLDLTEKVKTYANPGTVWMWTAGNKKKEQYFALTSQENSMMLTSLFLNYYIDLYCNEPSLQGKSKGDKIPEMFFSQKLAIFNEPGEKHIPNTIQLWLKRLHLGKKEWKSILQVEERKGWFYIDFLVSSSGNSPQGPLPLTKFLSAKKYAEARFEVLRDLTGLADVLPDIKRYIQTEGRESIRFDCFQFVDVFKCVLPMLRLLGINMLMPKALEKVLSPRISLRISAQAKGKSLSFVNLGELLGFDYQVALGDTLVSVSEFRKLTKDLSGIVKIRDQYVLITNDKLEKMFADLEKPLSLSSRELLKSALSEEFHGAKVELTADVHKLISELTTSARISLPDDLTATLRPYQISGYQWMIRNSAIGFGSLIADDMGLGKTVQVIAAVLKFKQDGKLTNNKVLTIVPTTLLTNWQKEIEKFAPTLTALVYHGTGRKLETKGADMIITTYGMIRSDLAKFKKIDWHAVVIDEAQNIKNASTDQTKAVKELKSVIRIAMSGTPVENRLSEYRSIMDFVNPGYLGTEKEFEAEFSNPIQINHDHEKAAIFRKITAPFILRRLKTDKSIISDLPDKFENNH